MRKSSDKSLRPNEKGHIHKKNWSATPIKVALVFPNTYYLGMSNLGFQTIYREINSRTDALCERVFLPDSPRQRVESLESGRGLKEFDLVGFSISFEPDYLNLLKILSHSGIPLFSRERGSKYPLLFAGGPAVTANPEPLGDFMDLFLMGEGEELIHEFLDHFSEKNQHPVGVIHEAPLQRIDGIYLPGIKNPTQRRTLLNFSSHAPADTQIFTSDTEFSNTYLIELLRGCPWQCRFCLAGFLYLPARSLDLDVAIHSIEKNLNHTRKIGLVGATVTEYQHIDPLCDYLLSQEEITVGVSSLRVNTTSEKIIRMLVHGRQRTMTIAPEAGSERLRRIINKDMSDEMILELAQKATHLGIRNLKFYFMVGIPYEAEEDYQDLVRLFKQIKARVKKGTGLAATFQPFVPKAHTPFQREGMASDKVLENRIAFLKKQLSPLGVEVRAGSIREAKLEGLLARGGREVGRLLLKALEHGDNFAAINRAAKELQFDLEGPLGRWADDKPLPWASVATGVKPDYLVKEADRGREGKITKGCPPESVECHRCGVC